jgi:hypothetical protein
MAAKKKITLKDIANRLETLQDRNAKKSVPIPKRMGAGDPNYIKNMIAAGKARRAQLPKTTAKDNSYVDRMYGPIANSAE